MNEVRIPPGAFISKFMPGAIPTVPAMVPLEPFRVWLPEKYYCLVFLRISIEKKCQNSKQIFTNSSSSIFEH